MFIPVPENSQDKGLLVSYKDDGKSLALTPEELGTFPADLKPRFERLNSTLADLDAKLKAGQPPEKYDLSIPEKSLLDAKRKEDVEAFAKANGLSAKAAQAILQREHDLLASSVKASQEALDGREKEWLAEMQADKEIGGEKFKESVALSSRVVAKFAPPELVKMFEETKQGNHPGFVKMMARIGKLLSDDQLVLGGGAPPKPKSAVEKLYDHPTSQKSN